MHGSSTCMLQVCRTGAASLSVAFFLFPVPYASEHKDHNDQHYYYIERRRQFIDEPVCNECEYEDYHPDEIHRASVRRFSFQQFFTCLKKSCTAQQAYVQRHKVFQKSV